MVDSDFEFLRLVDPSLPIKESCTGISGVVLCVGVVDATTVAVITLEVAVGVEEGLAEADTDVDPVPDLTLNPLVDATEAEGCAAAFPTENP